jgi:hypothetical protein
MVFTHICLENENKRMVEFKKLIAKQQLVGVILLNG